MAPPWVAQWGRRYVTEREPVTERGRRLEN